MSEFGVRRVLVVGDDDADLAWIARALRAAGLETDAIRGAVPACRALRAREYGAVVLDVEVADEGALAVVRAAGRSAPPARLVVLLSALVESPEGVLRSLELSGALCLRHPVDAAALAAMIQGEHDLPAKAAASVPVRGQRPAHRVTGRGTDALTDALGTLVPSRPGRSALLAAVVRRSRGGLGAPSSGSGATLDEDHDPEGRHEAGEGDQRGQYEAAQQEQEADRQGKGHPEDRTDPGDEDVRGDTVRHVDP